MSVNASWLYHRLPVSLCFTPSVCVSTTSCDKASPDRWPVVFGGNVLVNLIKSSISPPCWHLRWNRCSLLLVMGSGLKIMLLFRGCLFAEKINRLEFIFPGWGNLYKVNKNQSLSFEIHIHNRTAWTDEEMRIWGEKNVPSHLLCRVGWPQFLSTSAPMSTTVPAQGLLVCTLGRCVCMCAWS